MICFALKEHFGNSDLILRMFIYQEDLIWKYFGDWKFDLIYFEMFFLQLWFVYGMVTRVYWNFEFSAKWLAHKDLFVFGVLECRGKEIFTFEKFLPGGKLVWSFSIFIIWILFKITPKSMFFKKLPFRGQKMIFTPKQKLFQTVLGIIWFMNKKI